MSADYCIEYFDYIRRGLELSETALLASLDPKASAVSREPILIVSEPFVPGDQHGMRNLRNYYRSQEGYHV